MANVTVQVGQTLLDVAIQHLGAESAVADLAQLNELDMTADVEVGDVLKLPEVVNKRVVKVLKDGGHIPATNYISDDLEGIEYWDIEGDFIVS